MNYGPVPILPFLAALLCCTACKKNETPTPQQTATPPAPAPASATPPPPPLTPAAGQVALEIELLRAPAQLVAESIFAAGSDPAADAALREKLLAAGATTVVRSSVSGAPGEDLQENKLETTIEPRVFVYSNVWHRQGEAMKEGLELPQMTFEDYEGYAESHEKGHCLNASLTPSANGFVATVGFRWLGTPVIREVTSWPVKGRTAQQIHDRKWEAATELTLPAGPPVLLAAAPEPAEADGQPTGFVLLAFAKAAAGAGTGTGPAPQPAAAADPDPDRFTKVVQAWTLEVPAAAARPWLAIRKDQSRDAQQFSQWLNAAGKNNGPVLTSLEVVRMDLSNSNASSSKAYTVDSRLEWLEPRGFEPADTRYVKFVPVPNECRSRAVAHRLICERDEARLTLPSGTVQHVRWHGSTRGAKDEPVGVEATLNGSSEGSLFTGSEPGKIVLAAAHSHGPAVRLTFVRTAGSKDPFTDPHRPEWNISILETPADPWLPRLTSGTAPSALLPELRAAVNAGTATALLDDFSTPCLWAREEERPWLSFLTYINPSIHDGKFCFNPRFVSGAAPAVKLQTTYHQQLELTVSGEPLRRPAGLWLTGQPGYDAASSSLPLCAWPQLSLTAAASLQPDREAILSVCLGKSWQDPEKHALHWIIARYTGTGMKELFQLSQTSSEIRPADPAAPPSPAVSFTLADRDGSVREHLTLAVKEGTLTSGRQIQFLLPEGEIPANAPATGIKLSSLSIEQDLEGIAAELDKDRWTLTYCPEPARTVTDSLIGYTEQPVGTNYGPSENVPVSSERTVFPRKALNGPLPSPGTPLVQTLDEGRTLTVSVR